MGPRPIVQDEVVKYKEAYGVYKTTGVTGLWQVSGRNHTTYADASHMTLYVETGPYGWIFTFSPELKVIVTGAGAY